MTTPERVLGHYEVGAEIGAGGMGRVCVGTDVRDGSRVAIKFLQPLLAIGDPSFRDRFEREAHVAALLRSPYTVHLLDYGVSNGAPCIVMEFVEGESVATLLQRGPIPPRRAGRIARDAARALEEARARGVVHRDIKPENILLTTDGMARVADFGIARQEAADGVTVPGGYVGTAAYSAPEQFLGEAEHRSDLFALGATLYAMLTGVAPFGPTGTRALAAGRIPSVDYSGIPEPLANVIRRCIERDPRDRYHSADELAGALERVLAALPEDGPMSMPDPPRAVAEPTSVAAASLASAAAASPPTAVAATPVTVTTGRTNGPAKSGSGKKALAALALIVVVIGGGAGVVLALNGGGDGPKAAAVVSPTSATVAVTTSVAAGGSGSSSPATSPSSAASTNAAQPTATSAPPTRAAPTRAPTVAPTPVPQGATFIVSGEWDDNFTVLSTTDACSGDPVVGAVLTYSYLYEEGGSIADGQIDDGEIVKVSPLGELVIGDYTFHWPQLDYDYDINGGHATFSQRFLTPETGTASLTETYDDGCVVVMRDDG